MKKVVRVLVVICFLSALTIAADIPYNASLAAIGEPAVYPPFSETTLANCGPGPFLYMEIEAVGTMTHMGLTYDKQHHCIDLTTMTFDRGHCTLTAANGDTVFGEYFGELEITEAGNIIHGHFTTTGGTGRFNGVTGTGEALGVETRDSSGNITGMALTLAGMHSNVGQSKK